MKSKHFIYLSLLLPGIFLILSCERDKTSKDISTITYFPDFTINGDDNVFLEIGTPYTEPGVIATENGNPIDVTTSVFDVFNDSEVTEIDYNNPNKYIISYSATNSDGYDGSTERHVFVGVTGDMINSLEGIYLMSVLRTNNDEEYSEIDYCIIWEVDEDVYEISDAIGGFYAYGRGNGEDYRAAGATITVNNMASNDFTFTDAIIPAWNEDPPIEIVSMTVDAVNKTITMVSEWPVNTTTYHFDITLEQVEL